MTGFYDIPCETCIAYAACRSRRQIRCSILYHHLRKECPWDSYTISTKPFSTIERLITNNYIVYLNKFEVAIYDLAQVIYVYN